MLASFHDIDDDGSKLVGTVHNDAWLQALLAVIDGRWSEATTILTGNQDNFDYSEADYLRCNNATTITLRGLKAPATPAKPGKPLVIFAIGAGTVVLNDQDVNSTAANRLITGTSAAVTLAAVTGWAVVQYDATTARWRLRGSSTTTTVPNGGTGAVTLTAHGVLVGAGTSAIVATAAGTAGQALRSGGAAADPSYGEIPQTTTLTGTQNDFALTAGCHYLRCNNATLLTLTGLAAGYDGQRVVIESVGAGQVDLAHQGGASVLSTAANRLINIATSGNTSLAAGVGTAEIEYDATTARWRLVAHAQGDWITPTFAAGDFTANGSMTWTVDSGDRTQMEFYLKDRELHVAITLLTTTVGGTPSNLLQIAIPNGYTQATAAKTYTQMGFATDNGTRLAFFLIPGAVASTKIYAVKLDGTSWTASTNNTGLQGIAIFRVD